MKNTGAYIAFYGFLAIILYYTDTELIISDWIYSWGETPAWTIKI